MKRKHVEVFKGLGAQPWRWRVKAANGRVTETSGEGFVKKGNAIRAALKLGLPVVEVEGT